MNTTRPYVAPPTAELAGEALAIGTGAFLLCAVILYRAFRRFVHA